MRLTYSSTAQLELFQGPRPVAWLPDELFFSLCTRYHIISGAIDHQQTSRRLFGTSRIGRHHDFPTGLDAFVRSTEGRFGSIETIINNHTILPYFKPFYPDDRFQRLVTAMRGNSLGSGKSVLGLLGARFGAKHPLKACRKCMQADRERYGVAYWHRAHQSPSTWVCVEHHEPLAVSTASTISGRPYDWHLPDDQVLVWPADLSSLLQYRDELHGLAALDQKLLICPPGFTLARDRFLSACKYALRERDLLSEKGSIRIQKLADEYHRISIALRTVPYLGGLPHNLEQAADHLSRLLCADGRFAHPVKRLVLIRVLFGTWTDFLVALDAGEQ